MEEKETDFVFTILYRLSITSSFYKFIVNFMIACYLEFI